MKKFIPLVALLLMTTGCPSATTNTTGGTAPSKQTGIFGSEKSDMKVGAASVFKGETKVAIASFEVGFVTHSKASKQAGGGLFSGNAGMATANGTLVGVDDATFQKITDAAYQDFLTKLKAAGYTVAEQSSLDGNPAWEKATKKASPVGDDVKYFAPTGQKIVFNTGSFAIGFGHPNMAAVGVAKEGDTSLIYVNYVVDFLNAQTAGGKYSSYSSADFGQGISVRPGSGLTFFSQKESKCVGYCPNGAGTVALGQPVYSEEPYGELKDTVSGGEKAGMVALNVVSALGGLGTRSIKRYDVEADAGKYNTIATGTLKDANQKLVTDLAAQK